MRIISKFHDYYDGVQNYGGNDSSIIYVRETSKIEYSKLSYLLDNEFYATFGSDEVYKSLIQYYILGFCGKIYPVFEFKYNNLNTKTINIFYEQTYNKYTVFDFLKTILDLKSPINEHFWKKYLNWYNSHINNDYSVLEHTFVEFKVPIFLYRNETGSRIPTLTLNPNLGEFDFYKMIDAYQIFQEIEMYLSNVLVEDKDPTQITDDKVLLVEKGFDNNSFKQVSPGKKYKRRNKKI